MSATRVPLQPLRKGAVAKLWLGLALVVAAGAGLAWAGTRDAVAMADPAAFLAANARKEGVTTTASGLQIRTERAGSGETIGPDDGVFIRYEGRLVDGTVFDSTAQSGPVPMLVGEVVPGFSEALQRMRQGGAYEIWLPPELAYGDNVPPGGPIPPNAVLNFDIEVMAVVPDAARQMNGPRETPSPDAAPAPESE
ncbi:MAG: FKBP-type peptidyl-prolyl cis-trans isomerase [Sphingomonadaceae bacterium]